LPVVLPPALANKILESQGTTAPSLSQESQSTTEIEASKPETLHLFLIRIRSAKKHKLSPNGLVMTGSSTKAGRVHHRISAATAVKPIASTVDNSIITD